MPEFWNQSWFWPSVLVVVGLPIALIALTEVHAALVRRDSGAARIVRLVRNYVVPVGALFVLLSQTRDLNIDITWSRVTATVLGFLVILVLINGINFAVFSKARAGTWRERLPTIFVDVGRFLVIIISLALLFSVVWGADVGGLFTALGIGSIVIGLALQNAVGSVLSGLLLLFEQPFKLGDWLDAAGVRGRVEEVNWRSVHIRTTSGIQVIPNAELAGSGFTNLSRKNGTYTAIGEVRFTPSDPPQRVIETMVEVARDLPTLAPGGEPSAYALRKSRYEIDVPIVSPGDDFDTIAEFRRRLWYAARRAKLHLDADNVDEFDTDETRHAMLVRLSTIIQHSADELLPLLPRVAAQRYALGERIQHPGSVPDGIRVIMSGTARMVVEAAGGIRVTVTDFTSGDMLGLTALLRQGITASVDAVTEVDCLFVPVDVVDVLVEARPALARDIGHEIDNRRELVGRAFEAAGLERPSGSRIAY